MTDAAEQTSRHDIRAVSRKSSRKLKTTTIGSAAFLFLIAVTLGAMMGLLWWIVSPGGGIRRDELKKVQSWLSVDMIFCALSVAAGVVLMVIFIRSIRQKNVQGALITQTVVLMTGAAFGSCIAALLGSVLARVGTPVVIVDEVGDDYEVWFGLRSYASLTIYPLATAILCFAYFLWQMSADGMAADFEE